MASFVHSLSCTDNPFHIELILMGKRNVSIHSSILNSLLSLLAAFQSNNPFHWNWVRSVPSSCTAFVESIVQGNHSAV